MRCLMIPQIAVGEVMSESDFYAHLCIMRVLRDIEPSFFYVWLRSKDAKKVKPLPNTEYFFEELQLGFYQLMAGATGRLVELFNRQKGRYPVDVVFTSRAGLAPILALALSSERYKVGSVMPVVITEPRVYWLQEEAFHNKVAYTDTVIRGAGYATCYGIYWSDFERENALKCASLLLAPSAVKAMEERSFVVDALVDVPPPKAAKDPVRKRLIFAGRLNANKRWREILEAYAKVLMARTDVEVWLHSGTGAFSKLDKTNARWHRTSERLSTEAYLDLLASSHAGAYLSRDEGMNVTTQEMIASGIVMVLPKRPWVERILPNYPFTVKSPDELPPLLDYILDNYEECSKKLEPFRDLIRRRNGYEAFKSKFERVVEKIKEQNEKEGVCEAFRKIALDVLRERKSVKFSHLLSGLPGWTDAEPKRSAYRGMYMCYRAVREFDDMESADPVLNLRG